MSDLVSLPDGVLQLILKRVPLKDRLTSCCLVNRRMHAAANAVEELQVFPGAWLGKVPPVRLLEWISSCAHHLTKLEMSAFPQQLQQSPCQHLQDLRLEFGCNVRLSPAAAGGQPGVIEGCTNLTRLELRCNIIGSVGSLSKLVHLQHLDIVPLGMPGGYDSVDVPRATLPHLRHLTRICVRSLSSNNLAQLGGLTNLQVFTLCNIIGHDDPSLIVGPSSVPGLALPASLTRLRLLSPVEAGLLSLVPTGLQALHVECDVEDASSWSGSFLSGMGQLQHLTQLHIQAPDSFIWPPVSPAYSALTASSKLAHLALYGAEPPGSIWQYLFSATRKLPHLTTLRTNYGWRSSDFGVWGAEDLSSLVSCCPNLCTVDRLHVQHGSHRSKLQQLTALTSINLL